MTPEAMEEIEPEPFEIGETRRLQVNTADVDVKLLRLAGTRQVRHYAIATRGIDARIMVSRREASSDEARLAQLARMLLEGTEL